MAREAHVERWAEKLARAGLLRDGASMLTRRRLLGGFTSLTLVAVGAGVASAAALSLITREADARAAFESAYTMDQTFNAALRLVRVDRGYRVTEKDQGAGYVLFEYKSHESGDRVSAGSIEMVPSGGVIKVLIQIQQMPRYHEQVLADALERKLREEYGAPPPRKPSGDGAGGAGGAGGGAGAAGGGN